MHTILSQFTRIDKLANNTVETGILRHHHLQFWVYTILSQNLFKSFVDAGDSVGVFNKIDKLAKILQKGIFVGSCMADVRTRVLRR